MRRVTFALLIGSGVLAAELVLLSAGCAPKNPPPPATPAPAAAATPAPHWVQTPQLKGVMQRLAMSASSSWPKTLPSDVETPTDPAALDRSYAAAAELSDALAAAADRIPDTVVGKDLSPEVRRGFLAEAAILKGQAAELGREARGKRAEAMSRTLDQINATCVTCHSRYRDLAGTLDFPRAETPARPTLATAQ